MREHLRWALRDAENEVSENAHELICQEPSKSLINIFMIEENKWADSNGLY